MRNFRLNIDPLDPRSIDEAVKAFDEEVRRIDQNLDALMKHLAETGAQAARTAYDDVGAIDVDVHVESDGCGGYSIIASGVGLMYLEFVSSDIPEPEKGTAASGSGKKKSGGGRTGPSRMAFDELNGLRISTPSTAKRSRQQQMQETAEDEDDVVGRPAAAMLRAYEAVVNEVPNAVRMYFQ